MALVDELLIEVRAPKKQEVGDAKAFFSGHHHAQASMCKVLVTTSTGLSTKSPSHQEVPVTAMLTADPILPTKLKSFQRDVTLPGTMHACQLCIR